MRPKWTESKNVLWFVIGENGSLWLSTASFWRNKSIERWSDETDKPWRYWYRRGFRCHRVRLRHQVQS